MHDWSQAAQQALIDSLSALHKEQEANMAKLMSDHNIQLTVEQRKRSEVEARLQYSQQQFALLNDQFRKEQLAMQHDLTAQLYQVSSRSNVPDGSPIHPMLSLV